MHFYPWMQQGMADFMVDVDNWHSKVGNNSNPLTFQQHDETFGHGHYSFMRWPWTRQQVSDEPGADGSSLVPVCQHGVALTMIRS